LLPPETKAYWALALEFVVSMQSLAWSREPKALAWYANKAFCGDGVLLVTVDRVEGSMGSVV